MGSVNLGSSEEVLRAAGAQLPGHLRAVPDGEPGERTSWIGFQAEVFERHPDVERVPRTAGGYGEGLPLYRLRRGADPDAVHLGPLGYAEAAASSYALFRRLRDEGALPPGMRFQVCLPTPVATIAVFAAPESQPALEVAYERSLLDELRRIQEVVPATELALQWDLSVETGMWEGVGGLFAPWFAPAPDGLLERTARLSAHVGAEVPLGLHLCYGDFGGEPFARPTDVGRLVDMAAALLGRIEHPVAWLHLPVPRGADDIAYFAPLSGLRLSNDTELYLGLVHPRDRDGTARRIAAASEIVPQFGVATECGMGRVPREDVPDLLALHAQVAERR